MVLQSILLVMSVYYSYYKCSHKLTGRGENLFKMILFDGVGQVVWNLPRVRGTDRFFQVMP